MIDIDLVFCLFIAPCLLVKGTRAAAIVLLAIYPFIYLTKLYTDTGTIRYVFFAAQDAAVALIFLCFLGGNHKYKMEWSIAILAATAVMYHFIAYICYKHNIDKSFYTNSCIIIVILQISMLYARLIINGRVYSSVMDYIILLVAASVNYINCKKRSEKTKKQGKA